MGFGFQSLRTHGFWVSEPEDPWVWGFESQVPQGRWVVGFQHGWLALLYKDEAHASYDVSRLYASTRRMHHATIYACMLARNACTSWYGYASTNRPVSSLCLCLRVSASGKPSARALLAL